MFRYQNAINRALGLSPQPDSPPDTEEEQDELIEIEDTTEEDIQLSEEEQGSPVPGTRSPRPPLELIDLTDSPTISCPVSPQASQSRSLSQPPSPALQCPICLDTFSAIRSRGESCLPFILHFIHRYFFKGSS